MIPPNDWGPADGITLEPNALLAAREQGQNVVVSAGPGAGKTELLAQRADFLLTTGGCPYPRRILAISFKVDAARNIRERVRRRCGDHDFGPQRGRGRRQGPFGSPAGTGPSPRSPSRSGA